jgi:CMP-N-acetylneuraminic acid synthetase
MKYERICIIPARGGSKGLPGKNLKCVNGETLVRLALCKALASDMFDRVILSSDSSAILAEGELDGVTCCRRSAATASDSATSESVLEEVLDTLNIYSGMIVMIQCTTPLLTQEDISAAVELADRPEICTVVSGYADSLHHWVLFSDSSLIPISESGDLRGPRQSAQNRIFVENGGIYVTDIKTFLKSGSRFNGQVIPYLMDEADSIDIDTESDLIKVQERVLLRLK